MDPVHSQNPLGFCSSRYLSSAAGAVFFFFSICILQQNINCFFREKKLKEKRKTNIKGRAEGRYEL